jgi:hypothetical protein
VALRSGATERLCCFVAPSLGIEVIPVNMHDAGEIEYAVAVFAGSPNGGMIVTGSGLAVVNRELIITLAARHKLPAAYYERLRRRLC